MNVLFLLNLCAFKDGISKQFSEADFFFFYINAFQFTYSLLTYTCNKIIFFFTFRPAKVI